METAKQRSILNKESVLMSSELPSYVQFPNQDVLERRGYNVFSDELEQDEFVFFHATAEENVESILRS